MPSLKSRRATAVIASAVGAALIGLWQGVGTSIADRAMAGLYPAGQPAAAAAPAATQGSGPPATAAAAPLVTTAAAAPAAAPLSAEIVRLRAPLSVSAVGTGGDEAAACRSAVDQLEAQAGRQCERILIENGGATYRLDGAARECRSCGAVGQGWRCVASAAPMCIVAGEVEG